MKNFEIGKIYTFRLAGDHNLTYEATVVDRTYNSITFGIDGDFYTKRINKGLCNACGCEAVFPFGQYSHAPVLRADRELVI